MVPLPNTLVLCSLSLPWTWFLAMATMAGRKYFRLWGQASDERVERARVCLANVRMVQRVGDSLRYVTDYPAEEFLFCVHSTSFCWTHVASDS